MDGLNYLCLGGFLCISSFVIGGIIFLSLFFGTKVLISKKYGKKYSWIAPTLAFIVAIIVGGIFFYTRYAPAFPGYYSPKRRPSEADIVGEWFPRPDTLDLIEEFGYPPSTHKIEFQENGEFSMINMPDKFINRRDNIYYSGNGSWRIDQDVQGYWVVKVNFESLSPSYFPDPQLSGPPPCPGEYVPCGGLEDVFDLWNREPPFVLVASIIGADLDPDFYFIRVGDTHD
ncbi:MAG: hypothetical protein ABIG63_09180 [Chloroflexota bacterium]